MTRRILVPIDGSPHADAALQSVLFVLDPFGYYEERNGFPDRLDDWYTNLEKRADRLFKEAAERAGEHGVELQTATERGRPDRAIIAYAAENGFDGIVIGAHGRRDIAGVLLGSTAEKVTRRSQVPVTVVR